MDSPLLSHLLMLLSELDYDFPAHLIATEPSRPSRVLFHQNGTCQELGVSSLLEKFQAGDVLVLNESKVVKRRVFCQVLKADNSVSGKTLEVLFLKDLGKQCWQVLLPLSRLKSQQKLLLPNGVTAWVVESGKPQVLQVSENLTNDFFSTHGELPLPPYIQKQRKNRHNFENDQSWYQTSWARVEGSSAAPTASLHFSSEDLQNLEERGVKLVKIILHIGLGTFLPVEVDNLLDHQMHSEYVEIPKLAWDEIISAKKNKKRIWALGTTVARSLESCAKSMLLEKENCYMGDTKLFIYPGFKYEVVDSLLTNFHQPKTTLLALVMAFSSIEEVKKAYQWAIDKEFRLFSYGDLSVWM